MDSLVACSCCFIGLNSDGSTKDVTASIAARAPAGCMAEQFDRNASKKPEDGKNQGKRSPSASPQVYLRFKSILYPSSRGGCRFKRLSNLLRWRSSRRKLKSATGTWPLLLDASFGLFPRVDMFKCLFKHGADCDVVCDDTCDGVGSRWTIVLDGDEELALRQLRGQAV